MRTRLAALISRLRSAYWFIPTIMAIGAVVLAFGSIKLDEIVHGAVEARLGWVYAGGPEGARAVLATIAGSVITVAGTTFSITIAAFSLASSQFGPRLLRTFRRDTGNQIVLGTFIATFLYCLLVLRSVRGTESDTYVPDLSVTLGVVLACFSLAVLIFFIHHTAASIQVSNLIDSVGEELDSIIEKNFKGKSSAAVQSIPVSPSVEAFQGSEAARQIISSDETGYLLRLDYEALAAAAERRDCVIYMLKRPGDFIVRHTPLLEARGVADESMQWDEVKDSIYLGTERSPEQDIEFGFLQLAEIGVRALSPGINDPFTAVTCIDRITAGLCLLSRKERPCIFHRDAHREVRVVERIVTYSQIVQASFLHIMKAGAHNAWLLQHLVRGIEVVISTEPNEEYYAALRKLSSEASLAEERARDRAGPPGSY